MRDDHETVGELARSAILARFRVLRVEGEEQPDRSWQSVTCHIHREDLSWAAIPLAYAIAALSFADARPRGASDVDYREGDEWRLADLAQRLRFERGALVLDTDYVRGRLMKTRVTVADNGKLVVETRNRHEMALRWLGTLKGRRHLRLVAPADAANPRVGPVGA
jgi:hypothetical protein